MNLEPTPTPADEGLDFLAAIWLFVAWCGFALFYYGIIEVALYVSIAGWFAAITAAISCASRLSLIVLVLALGTFGAFAIWIYHFADFGASC